MIVADFKKDFGRFRFSFSHDGKEPKVYAFDETDVNALLKRGLDQAEQDYEVAKKRLQGMGGSQIRINPE